MNSNYYPIDQFQTLKLLIKISQYPLFHINACSISETFDDLEHLPKCIKKVLDVLAVSKTMITKEISLTSNINFQNYHFKFTSIESNAWGTLLYIANHLFYKLHTDLSLNKASQLESPFIEIINSIKINIIVGCLYKHPNFDVSDFNGNYLNTILDKLSKKQVSFSSW